MAEVTGPAGGFGENARVQFYYDEASLAFTRCVATGWAPGSNLSVKAIATPDEGDPWEYVFAADADVPVAGVEWASSALDGVRIQFEATEA